MQPLRFTAVAAVVLSFASGAVLADADDHDHANGNHRQSVTASFGAGLNTAQPGNAANHKVLPKVIKVKVGGVVNLAVAGFHHPIVYQPGKALAHVVVPNAGLFINDFDRVYYRGIAPAGGPPPATPATLDPSNASNRMETVSFAAPGTYLVICNVRPHFLDGMYGYIVVSD